MLDKQMRHVKEAVTQPIARWIGTRISPTQITLVGGVIGIASAIFASQEWYIAGLGLCLLNRVLDGLDGTVARMYNRQSDFGAYLDILVDNLMYAIIPIALAMSIGTPIAYATMMFLFVTFYLNGASWMYLSSILEKRAQGAKNTGEMTTVTMPDGLMEGTETIAFFILFFLFPQFLSILFVIMGVLALITIAQRLHWAYYHLD